MSAAPLPEVGEEGDLRAEQGFIAEELVSAADSFLRRHTQCQKGYAGHIVAHFHGIRHDAERRAKAAQGVELNGSGGIEGAPRYDWSLIFSPRRAVFLNQPDQTYKSSAEMPRATMSQRRRMKMAPTSAFLPKRQYGSFR